MLILFVCCGCSSLLPSSQDIAESKWESYLEVSSDFEKIKPGKTLETELKEIGIDFEKTPNITKLSITELMEMFKVESPEQMSNENLPEGVLYCFRTEHCKIYKIDIRRIYKKRYGNFFLDLFKFRIKSRSTGWRFSSLIIIIKGRVVYKLVAGQPNINLRELENNPLGPFQNIDFNILKYIIDSSK
jgi:hypothetical protein